MAVHLAAASGWSPDATETQDARQSRRRRGQVARLISAPASCGPASRSSSRGPPADDGSDQGTFRPVACHEKLVLPRLVVPILSFWPHWAAAKGLGDDGARRPRKTRAVDLRRLEA